jgi:hypothetical protein
MAQRQKSTRNTATKHGGKRVHFRGKTVREDGSPRSHTHGGHSQATGGFTMGDTAERALQTKAAGNGRFRVSEPTKRWHRRGIVRNATTGGCVS